MGLQELKGVESQIPEQIAETCALGWKEHLDRFIEGEEKLFSYYLVLSNELHQYQRRQFLALARVSHELPRHEDERIKVADYGRVTLWAASNFHDEENPVDVTYYGTRIPSMRSHLQLNKSE